MGREDTRSSSTLSSSSESSSGCFQRHGEVIVRYLKESNLEAAHKVLDRLDEQIMTTTTTTRTTTASNDPSVLDDLGDYCYTAVMDGWMDYLKQQQKQKQNTFVNVNNDNNKREEGVVRPTKEVIALIKEMLDAAERIHTIFEMLHRKQQLQVQVQQQQQSSSSSLSNSDDEHDNSVGTAVRRLQPTQHHYDTVLTAWLDVTRTMFELLEDGTTTTMPPSLRGRGRGIPQRAHRVLEQMTQQQQQQQTSSSGDDAMTTTTKVQPTVGHYNTVMEIWGKSYEHLRGTMIETLYRHLLALSSSTGSTRSSNSEGEQALSSLKPNNETYVILIHAWCRSKQDRAAFTATGHLMKVHRLMTMENNDNDEEDVMKLSLEDYKTILDAWTRAGDKLAPQKAFWVIKLMQKAYVDRVSEIRPDVECYRYVLETYSRSTLPNLGRDVDELIDQMEDRFLLTPDSECYTLAIRTWKNTATHFQNEGTQQDDATRASRLLTRMEKAYHRSSEVAVQTTTENYNDVIQAWSTSSKAGAAIHAESLLKKMEKAYSDGDSHLKPDADSYRWALEAWATSRSRDKLNHAVTILSRMKDLTEGSEDDHAKPTVDVFNAFIHVCGTSDSGSTQDKKYNFKLAVNTVDEMRKRGEAPNSTTFRLLLEACENLLPLSKGRSRAVEDIFRNCCHLGLVNDEVLAQFQAVASEELYTNVVVANSTEDEIEGTRSSKMVPDSWTRNVGVRVVTADGKKPKPLNIDAMFVVTKRVKEFRVKRLRQKKNKRLLQAGRKLYVKNSRMAN